jgi:hypothetical protein
MILIIIEVTIGIYIFTFSVSYLKSPGSFPIKLSLGKKVIINPATSMTTPNNISIFPKFKTVI